MEREEDVEWIILLHRYHHHHHRYYYCTARAVHFLGLN